MSEEQRVATPGVHQITVGLKGFPDVPDQHGNGILSPDFVEFFYFPNGHVAARLYGVWTPEDDTDADGRARNNYRADSKDATEDWPDWLAAQVREHAPVQLTDAARVEAVASILRRTAYLVDQEDLPQTANDTADFCDGVRWATGEVRRLANEVTAEDPAWRPDGLTELAQGLSLNSAERAMLRYALELAEEQMLSRGNEFAAVDHAALESLKQSIGGTER